EVFEMNLVDAMAGFGTHHPAPAAVAAKKPGRVQPAAVDTSASDDDDAPPGMAGNAKKKAAPPPPPPVQHAAAPVDTAAVDGDATAEAPTPTEVPASAPSPARTHHADVGLLFGIVSRSFVPSDGTVKDYSSTPVGTAGVAFAIEPVRHVEVAAMYEHTL